MHDIGLTHIGLPAKDLDACIDFYAAYARMEVVHRRRSVVWLSDRTRPFVIVLIRVEHVAAPLLPFAHLGVGCESREEVDRLCARAAEEDRLIQGPTDSGPPVGYWALIRDPSGHTLEVSYGQEVGWTVDRAGERTDGRDA